jgi:hypothetical protein
MVAYAISNAISKTSSPQGAACRRLAEVDLIGVVAPRSCIPSVGPSTDRRRRGHQPALRAISAITAMAAATPPKISCRTLKPTNGIWNSNSVINSALAANTATGAQGERRPASQAAKPDGRATVRNSHPAGSVQLEAQGTEHSRRRSRGSNEVEYFLPVRPGPRGSLPRQSRCGTDGSFCSPGLGQMQAWCRTPPCQVFGRTLLQRSLRTSGDPRARGHGVTGPKTPA